MVIHNLCKLFNHLFELLGHPVMLALQHITILSIRSNHRLLLLLQLPHPILGVPYLCLYLGYFFLNLHTGVKVSVIGELAPAEQHAVLYHLTDTRASYIKGRLTVEFSLPITAGKVSSRLWSDCAKEF